MSCYREGVPKTLPAVLRFAAHAPDTGGSLGRARASALARHHRDCEGRSPRLLIACLFFLVCFALLMSLTATARAAVCPAGGATNPAAPQATFLYSYRVAFNAPARLAVDAADRVYIADPKTGRIVVRDAEGRVVHAQTDLGAPSSVAVDGQDRIYVGDGTAGKVTVYSRDWAPLFLLGQGDGEFTQPGDIAVDNATGNVYVTDTKAHRVNVYGGDGKWLRSFGEEGRRDGQFNHPSGVFVTADAVLVADQRNGRIQRFDLDGNFCAVLGRRSVNYPQGIWVDNSGRILVADAFQGHVVVLDDNGNKLGVIGEFGDAQGKLRTPQDVVMDSYGRLFVTSANGARVDIFGISPYSDPERYVPATVQILPGQLDRAQTGGTVTGLIEMPGYPLSSMVTGSVTANGVPAVSGSWLIGDNNRNGTLDVLVNFSGDALLATLPTSDYAPVTVRGGVGAMLFEATATVAVAYTVGNDDIDAAADGSDVAAADDDADGVVNGQDLCAGSGGSQAVDGSGCSIAQYCPAAGGAWENHGQYVTCVRRYVRQFVDAGVLSAREGRALVVAARGSGGRGARVALRRAQRAGAVAGAAASASLAAVPSATAVAGGGEAVATGGVLQNILGYLGFRFDAPASDTVTDAAVDVSAVPHTEGGAGQPPASNDAQTSETQASEPVKTAEDLPEDQGDTDTAQSDQAAEPVADADGDGVSDYTDMCPGSDAQDAIDTNGCSVVQLCACDSQSTGTPRDTHRRYVACVSQNADVFVAAGLLSERHRSDLVDSAAAASCGAPGGETASDDTRDRERQRRLAMRRGESPSWTGYTEGGAK